MLVPELAGHNTVVPISTRSGYGALGSRLSVQHTSEQSTLFPSDSQADSQASFVVMIIFQSGNEVYIQQCLLQFTNNLGCHSSGVTRVQLLT
jgi:hypothetical protein